MQNDALRLGEAFTEEALKLLEPFASKPYALFSYDKVQDDQLSLNEPNRVPYDLFLTGVFTSFVAKLTRWHSDQSIFPRTWLMLSTTN